MAELAILAAGLTLLLAGFTADHVAAYRAGRAS